MDGVVGGIVQSLSISTISSFRNHVILTLFIRGGTMKVAAFLSLKLKIQLVFSFSFEVYVTEKY